MQLSERIERGFTFLDYQINAKGLKEIAPPTKMRFLERVTRLDELVQVVGLGNTPSVAMRNYLMTTDGHFAAAVKGEPKAAHYATQQMQAKAHNASQNAPTAHEKTPWSQSFDTLGLKWLGPNSVRTVQIRPAMGGGQLPTREWCEMRRIRQGRRCRCLATAAYGEIAGFGILLVC